MHLTSSLRRYDVTLPQLVLLLLFAAVDLSNSTSGQVTQPTPPGRRSSCPHRCYCGGQATSGFAIQVQCARRGLDVIPPLYALPVGTRLLNMNGNRFRSSRLERRNFSLSAVDSGANVAEEDDYESSFKV